MSHRNSLLRCECIHLALSCAGLAGSVLTHLSDMPGVPVPAKRSAQTSACMLRVLLTYSASVTLEISDPVTGSDGQVHVTLPRPSRSERRLTVGHHMMMWRKHVLTRVYKADEAVLKLKGGVAPSDVV